MHGPLPDAPVDVHALIEACYRPAATADAWCRAIVDAGERALPVTHGLGIVVTRHHAQGVAIVARELVRLPEPVRDAASRMGELDPVADRGTLYPPRPITQFSVQAATFSASTAAWTRRVLRESGARDILGVLGYAADDVTFTLGVPLQRAGALSPKLRAQLERVRLHLELGLRAQLDGHDADPLAVLGPRGQLLHQAASPLDGATLVRMRAHVRQLERTRRRSTNAGDDALAGWEALVDGRWGVVERVDADGRRAYHVIEHPAAARRHRALSRAEVDTLRAFSLGMSGKEAAARTGRAPSTISETLTRIADKLGLRSREHALRFAQQLTADARLPHDLAALTASEREVLALLAAGSSMVDVMARRRTSIHTVRKQVAALCRKLDAPSRHALATIDPSLLTEPYRGGRLR